VKNIFRAMKSSLFTIAGYGKKFCLCGQGQAGELLDKSREYVTKNVHCGC